MFDTSVFLIRNNFCLIPHLYLKLFVSGDVFLFIFLREILGAIFASAIVVAVLVVEADASLFVQ